MGWMDSAKSWFENTFDPNKNGVANGAKWLGNKIEDGLNFAKNEGIKLYEKVKELPVIGDIAKVIEASPIGTIIGSGIQGIDSALRAGTSVLRGDFKGALEKGGEAVMNLM